MLRPTGNIGCRDKISEALHDNIGEKSIVILSTNNINRHDVGTPKQTQTRYKVILDQEFQTTVQCNMV